MIRKEAKKKRMKLKLKISKYERGEGILVFVALLPILILVLLLALQIGVIGYSKIAAQYVANTAAETAATKPSQGIIPTAYLVADELGSRVLYQFSYRGMIDVSGSTEPGQLITVTIEYNFPKFSVISTMFRIPQDMTVKSESTAVVQEAP